DHVAATGRRLLTHSVRVFSTHYFLLSTRNTSSCQRSKRWHRVTSMEAFRKLWGGAGAAVVTLALVWAGLLEPLETWSLDRLFELRGARAPTTPIVIVTIDESSFVELNTQWPFPRALHGKLLDRISAGRPLAIGLDLIFDVPSSRGPKDDAALGAAVARAGNVVLGSAPTEDEQPIPGLPGKVYTRV